MYLASKTSVNMADIPTVLVLILVNVISFVEYVDGDYDYPWCPTLVEGCYCRRKYNTDYYHLLRISGEFTTDTRI